MNRRDYLDARGCPDLQKIIGLFDGYAAIPEWAWAWFDADLAVFRVRMTAFSPVSIKRTPRPWRSYPKSEECCDCYQHGAFGYSAESLRRMEHPELTDPTGEMVWFCDRHRPGKFFADAGRT
jgi:hypothetical protein